MLTTAMNFKYGVTKTTHCANGIILTEYLYNVNISMPIQSLSIMDLHDNQLRVVVYKPEYLKDWDSNIKIPK